MYQLLGAGTLCTLSSPAREIWVFRFASFLQLSSVGPFGISLSLSLTEQVPQVPPLYVFFFPPWLRLFEHLRSRWFAIIQRLWVVPIIAGSTLLSPSEWSCVVRSLLPNLTLSFSPSLNTSVIQPPPPTQSKLFAAPSANFCRYGQLYMFRNRVGFFFPSLFFG